jgi:hypothetical protein
MKDERWKMKDEKWKMRDERREMKDERWKMKDERWKMKNERWKMKDERWKMKDERWNPKLTNFIPNSRNPLTLQSLLDHPCQHSQLPQIETAPIQTPPHHHKKNLRNMLHFLHRIKQYFIQKFVSITIYCNKIYSLFIFRTKYLKIIKSIGKFSNPSILPEYVKIYFFLQHKNSCAKNDIRKKS